MTLSLNGLGDYKEINMIPTLEAKLNRSELENLKSMSSNDLLSGLCNYDSKLLSALSLVEPTDKDYIPKDHMPKLGNSILAVNPNLKGLINGLYKYLGY